MTAALLDVTVIHARDVAGCEAGGADRLTLAVPDEQVGRSPDLAAAAPVIRGTDLPVRVMLRLGETYSTTGGEFTRLVGLAEEYLALGAEGVVFGFLDADLELDVETCLALAASLPGVPWTLHRAVDATLDARQTWRRVARLQHVSAVASAGSLQGPAHGYDELLTMAAAAPEVARLLMPAGGLLAEHVPWFARAGVRQFGVDEQVRPGATHRSYVDADYVRSWRLVLDDATARADAG